MLPFLRTRFRHRSWWRFRSLLRLTTGRENNAKLQRSSQVGIWRMCQENDPDAIGWVPDDKQWLGAAMEGHLLTVHCDSAWLMECIQNLRLDAQNFCDVWPNALWSRLVCSSLPYHRRRLRIFLWASTCESLHSPYLAMCLFAMQEQAMPMSAVETCCFNRGCEFINFSRPLEFLAA